MTQTHWLEIDPVDTLFFRGTESMVAGENHEADTMFPPMPSTLAGAIRTAIMAQKGIPPADYCSRPGQWTGTCPMLGTPDEPGFRIIGPLFRIRNIDLFPAPAHWLADLDDKAGDGDVITVQAARPYVDQGLGLAGSTPAPFWVHEPAAADIKPLTGYWVTSACFAAMSTGRGQLMLRKSCTAINSEEAGMLAGTDLLQREKRVGIALTPQRTVREGHLYSTTHVRLHDSVRIIAGLESEHPFCLDQQGILQLGGEQRVCSYAVTSAPNLPVNTGGTLYYALSPLASKNVPADQPRSSAALLRTGGWDMARGFHKPLQSWFPAGTVLLKDSGNADLSGCIPI